MKQRISTRILVVGTDTYFCYLLSRYVRESAHELILSALDSKALDLALSEKPALIILEDDLPKTKGRDMIKEFKSNQATCQIPVVSCSWHIQDSEETSCDADFYLHMPILYGDFKAILDDLGI